MDFSFKGLKKLWCLMLKITKPPTSRAVIVSGYLADGLPLKYFESCLGARGNAIQVENKWF